MNRNLKQLENGKDKSRYIISARNSDIKSVIESLYDTMNEFPNEIIAKSYIEHHEKDIEICETTNKRTVPLFVEDIIDNNNHYIITFDNDKKSICLITRLTGMEIVIVVMSENHIEEVRESFENKLFKIYLSKSKIRKEFVFGVKSFGGTQSIKKISRLVYHSNSNVIYKTDNINKFKCYQFINGQYKGASIEIVSKLAHIDNDNLINASFKYDVEDNTIELICRFKSSDDIIDLRLIGSDLNCHTILELLEYINDNVKSNIIPIYEEELKLLASLSTLKAINLDSIQK